MSQGMFWLGLQNSMKKNPKAKLKTFHFITTKIG